MRRFLIVFLVLLTGACKTTQTTGGTSPAAQPATVPAPNGWQEGGPQTRVLILDDCLMEPHTTDEANPSPREFVLGVGAAAIVSAILPKIINVATDAGTAYLERRKTELTASNTGRGVHELYSPAVGSPGKPPVTWWRCLAFVRIRDGARVASLRCPILRTDGLMVTQQRAGHVALGATQGLNHLLRYRLDQWKAKICSLSLSVW